MLPDANEPLRLANGTLVDANGRVVKEKPAQRMTMVPSNTQARELVIKANRRIADLPALPDRMNGLSAILVYTMFGLADTEIAVATGLTIEQIKTIRSHDAYHKLQEDVTANIIAADQDRIRSVINQHTDTAINRVVSLMESEDDKTALKASQDILDRGGHRPVDIVHHKHSLEGTLRVVHVEKKSTHNIPVIDVFGNDVKETSNDAN